MTPAIGTSAPEFTLRDHADTPVSLAELRQGGPVVLFFYPKDETYGCTREACAFRDEHPRFVAAGAQVVGISDDPPDDHRKFRARFGLPMRLLSDPGGAVRKLYGVGAPLGLKGRVTFVIDRQGTVRNVFSSQVRFAKHADDALAVVRTL